MRKKKCLLILLSIGLMVLGAILYLIFNRSAFVSSVASSLFGLGEQEQEGGFIARIVQCYGADFLWSAAFTMVVQVILNLEGKKIWFLLVCSTLGMLFELMQALGLASGTADTIDVIVYVIGSVFSVLFIMALEGGNHEKGQSSRSSHSSNCVYAFRFGKRQ